MLVPLHVNYVLGLKHICKAIYRLYPIGTDSQPTNNFCQGSVFSEKKFKAKVIISSYSEMTIKSGKTKKALKSQRNGLVKIYSFKF
jgi:hypothetical protein